MGSGRSGIPKGIKNVSSKTTKGDLRVRAKSAGYDITSTDATLKKYRDPMNTYIDELEKFQTAMRETDEIKQAAGGELSIRRLRRNVGGEADIHGHITLNSTEMPYIKWMRDTLPHEHTHNLVKTLITKELGFKRGTSEFHKAYMDSVIDHSINQAALENYKKYMSRQYDRIIKDFSSKLTDTAAGQIAKQVIDDTRKDKAALATITIEQASKSSGMRDYALRQYPWTPKGHYIEMPTVATEVFQKHGYNFKSLLENSPYSYFVLQNLYSRLHKGKKRK